MTVDWMERLPPEGKEKLANIIASHKGDKLDLHQRLMKRMENLYKQYYQNLTDLHREYFPDEVPEQGEGCEVPDAES